MSTNLDLNAAGTLATLTERLIRHGVSVPGLKKWQELTAELIPRPAPELPSDLLQRSPDELHQYAQRVALHRTIAHTRAGGYLSILTELQGPLDQALLESICNNASDIIAQLRPAFDGAADAIRKAKALGVKHDDDLRSLFEADKPVRTAWLSTQTHARTLDDLLTTRQQLSVVAGVQPAPGKLGPNQPQGGTGINWSSVVTSPGAGAGLDPYSQGAPWQRWIKAAEHLQLVDPVNVTAFDSLAMNSRGLASKLSAEAQRRHDQASRLIEQGKQAEADRQTQLAS